MNCSCCIWMGASQCCLWTSFTWSEHWMFMHGRLVLHSHVSPAQPHTLRNVTTDKRWFISTLPWHLNFSHIVIPWPKLCGTFPMSSMPLVWWLCNDASWGNSDFYDFYWSFWIITIETQQVILFYRVNMSYILHKLIGLLAVVSTTSPTYCVFSSFWFFACVFLLPIE